MRPNDYQRIAFLCCCLLFFGASGCEEKSEAPPPQPKVVAQKISPVAAPKSAAPAAPQKTAPPPPAAAPQAASPTAVSGTAKGSPDASGAGTSQTAPTAEDSTAQPTMAPAGDEKSAEDAAQQTPIDVKSTMATLEKKVATEGNTLYRARFYDPEGKLDPFAPIFKQSAPETVTETGTKKKREKRVPQTPLERLSLGQLTLVGVIRMPSGNRAIVQEASGKGYVVKNGTYIGTDAGRVVDIEAGRVVIEEEVENVLGDVITRKQELKLQKPLGEE